MVALLPPERDQALAAGILRQGEGLRCMPVELWCGRGDEAGAASGELWINRARVWCRG